MENNNKQDYMIVVIETLREVFSRHEVRWPNRVEESNFKRDLIAVVTEMTKGSFKNGIRVGMKRAGQDGDYKKGEAH